MEGLGNARTEADLRAALAKLGQRATGADDVLTALRAAGRPRRTLGRPGRPWPGRRLGWPKLVVGAVAAATAVTLTLTLNGSSAPTGGPAAWPLVPNPSAPVGGSPPVASPGGHPSTAALAKAMLTAFSAATGDLAYQSADYFKVGRLVQTDRDWIWPAIPSPGQVAYVRDEFGLTPKGASATAPVKPTEDDGYTTVVPRPSRYEQKEPARLIMVCFAGTGQTGCGWGQIDTPAGTWSEHAGVMPYIDYTPTPRGADLARQIARGEWRIVGHTRLRGQPAIKLAETRSGQYQGGPVFLWVSTASYLPLRMDWGPAKSIEIDNWYYLPPSKANLAQLRVPIPHGYPRSS